MKWFLLTLCLFAPHFTFAQAQKEKKPVLDVRSSVVIQYTNKDNNTDPHTVEKAIVVLREGKSGKLVRVVLQETAPDSAVFSKQYPTTWKDLYKAAPEFFVVPLALHKRAENDKQITELVAKNEITRRPFISRKTPTGAQNIEIYETRDEARAALKSYKSQLQSLKIVNKKYPSDSEMDAAALALAAKEREIAARNSAERARLSEAESAKANQQLRQFQSLGANERKKQKDQAKLKANEAMGFYQAQKYNEAQSKFEEAIQLNPEEKNYFFQLGVIMYKKEQFNRAIVLLNMASGAGVNNLEKDYFLALNFFRLKEYTSSITYFQQVQNSNQVDLAPSARFYIALVLMEQKKYDEARTSLQAVLDTSKDPRLDEQAEQLIEQILRLKQFEAERAKKWQLSGTLGFIYDSNILQISNATLDQGTATDTNGYRGLFQFSGRHRPVYEQTEEFAIQLDMLYMYSVNASQQEARELRNTDPFVATLTFPWTKKGVLFSKGHKLDLTPGLETIFMSVEDNKNKEIARAYFFNIANTLVMNDSWFATYNLELRRDDSQLNSSTGDDNADAFKSKLSNGNMFFIDAERTKMITADFAYTLNNATGKNTAFDRVDFGLGYLTTIFGGLAWSTRASYFYLNYGEKTSARIDNSYTLTTGLSRKLTELLTLGFSANYNINKSNTEANDFNRWSTMVTLSAMSAF